MPIREPRAQLATHVVINQVGPMGDVNVFDLDVPLQEAFQREGIGWLVDQAREVGAVAGSERVQELARLANVHVPELRPFDRWGRRIDEVEFHPAYHELMRLGFKHEVSTIAWRTDQPNGMAAHAALSILLLPGRGRRHVPDEPQQLGAATGWPRT